jgi:hypothetical protein
LAEAVSLDMTGYWRPTVRTYLGRITKARILEAVREAVSDEMAGRMAQMKKQDMAEAAKQLLAATGWLPALMRTPRAAQGSSESPQPDAVTEAKDTEAYFVAAESMALKRMAPSLAIAPKYRGLHTGWETARGTVQKAAQCRVFGETPAFAGLFAAPRLVLLCFCVDWLEQRR